MGRGLRDTPDSWYAVKPNLVRLEEPCLAYGGNICVRENAFRCLTMSLNVSDRARSVRCFGGCIWTLGSVYSTAWLVSLSFILMGSRVPMLSEPPKNM